MNSDTQRGIGERQVHFRAQNERIYASADSLHMIGQIPFICECADDACTEIVRMRDDEYDTISQHPRRFFNISGHETSSVDAGAEKIVAVIGELTIVEKIGIAGDLATHERARGGE